MPGGLLVGDIPSKRPSLANVLLCAANPEETPFVTRVKKGKKLRQMEHKYFVEEKPTRRTGGATDGQDVSSFEKGGPRRALNVRAQEFRRSYKVGQQTQEIIEDEAVPDQIAKLRKDMGAEIMKDVEAVAMSDTVSAEDTGQDDLGPRMSGIGYQLSVAADTMADFPIHVNVRIPAAQVYSGTYANFNETTLTDEMEARRNACGNSAELVAFMGTKIQRKFDVFENFIPNEANHTAVLRTMSNQKQERTVKRGIRFYEGSFGFVELVIDDFIIYQKRGYLLDMDQVEWLPTGNGATRMPLPDLGGGPRELLKFTGSYKIGDPRGHIKIKPSDEAS